MLEVLLDIGELLWMDKVETLFAEQLRRRIAHQVQAALVDKRELAVHAVTTDKLCGRDRNECSG